MPKLKTFLPGLVALCLAACDGTSREYQDHQQFFNNEIKISLYGVDKAIATQAFTTLREDFEYMHFMWHPWQPGPLGRTNELLAMTSEFSANPSVLPLIEKSRTLTHASNYLYNPAIGKLMALWGFHQDTAPNGPLPAVEQIAALVAQNPTVDDIELNGVRMKSTNPALQLDFGAVAKGLAMERETIALKKMGIQHACINAGGDVKVIGKRGEQPWQITIPAPRDNEILAALDVYDGESVFTTKDNDHFFEYSGMRYHHVLDPRTGYPADHTMLVTVIHPDALTAAAASTALFVAGPEEWRGIADSMDITHVMLIDKQGRAHLTPAMAKRIRFYQQPAKIEISRPLETNM